MDTSHQREPLFESMEVSGWLICLTESCIAFLLHWPISLAMAFRAKAVCCTCVRCKHSRELLLAAGGFIIEAFVTSFLSQHACDLD